MAGQDIKRRLAAIMSADVVGYSRLMGEDEAGTLASLKALRREVFAPQVAAHHGRIVKLMGDGALVEFPSVVDAVTCAVAVQHGMAERNAEVPKSTRVALRIGINLGDIIIEGEDIYGDGVNVAARIQELAEPGGVALSAIAHDQVAGKIEATFEDAGECELKNIAKPVRVYRWTKLADASLGATAPPPLPDKPSIAVLPFDNMSGDPEQEYFADGITEDLITGLCRYPDLLVIARNSTFVYKGRAVDPKMVGRELGVRYLLEGGIRKVGNRVRITAQLIDAHSGHHVWADRYDRELAEIFELQDEITRVIVGAVGATLGDALIDDAERKDPAHLNAYDLVLRAWAAFAHSTKVGIAESRELLERAIAIDPRYARPHASIAWTHLNDRWAGYTNDPDRSLRIGFEEASKAVLLDTTYAPAHVVLGITHLLMHNHDQAVVELEQAIELSPSYADSYAQLANALGLMGRTEEALEAIDTAMRLNPHFPGHYLLMQGRAYVIAQRYEEALPPLQRSVSMVPGMTQVHATLAAAYAALGRLDNAKVHVERIKSLSPSFGRDYVRQVLPFMKRGDMDDFIALLEKAGLPE